MMKIIKNLISLSKLKEKRVKRLKRKKKYFNQLNIKMESLKSSLKTILRS
jgi:hypothetical protein